MSDLNFQYNVVRSRKRKTAAIRINEKGIEVRVPHWVTDEWVSSWVSERSEWVQKHSTQLARNMRKSCLNIEEGAAFPFLGNTYPITWKVGPRTLVTLAEEQLHIVVSNRSKKAVEERVKNSLQAWYKTRAESCFRERVQYWQTVMNLDCNSLSIKSYKRRWGSCNARGDITFNWRLIFADEATIDYVVIHELAHLVHLNHSREFWSLVELYCPNWKVLRDELQKCNGWVLW
jgi:predicted metal-dependent hydrolase